MTDEITISQDEEPEVLPRPKYDDLPEPLDCFEKWLTEYRLRLHHAVFLGRNGARDKALLGTLAFGMESQGAQVFDASVRWLVIHGGMYDQAIQKALITLRDGGYVKRHMVSGVDGSEYAKDGRRAVHGAAPPG